MKDLLEVKGQRTRNQICTLTIPKLTKDNVYFIVPLRQRVTEDIQFEIVSGEDSSNLSASSTTATIVLLLPDYVTRSQTVTPIAQSCINECQQPEQVTII